MRFWSAITRGAKALVRLVQGTHALRSKARSPDPATMPHVTWMGQKLPWRQAERGVMSFELPAAWVSMNLYQMRFFSPMDSRLFSYKKRVFHF